MSTISKTVYFIDGLLNLKGEYVRKKAKEKALKRIEEEKVEIEIFGKVNKTYIDALDREIETGLIRKGNHQLNYIQQRKLEMNQRLYDELHHQSVITIMKDVRSFLTECKLRGCPKNITNCETLLGYKEALEDFETLYRSCGGK